MLNSRLYECSGMKDALWTITKGYVIGQVDKETIQVVNLDLFNEVITEVICVKQLFHYVDIVEFFLCNFLLNSHRQLNEVLISEIYAILLALTII